jgi:hypothetical protein
MLFFIIIPRFSESSVVEIFSKRDLRSVSIASMKHIETGILLDPCFYARMQHKKIQAVLGKCFSGSKQIVKTAIAASKSAMADSCLALVVSTTSFAFVISASMAAMDFLLAIAMPPCLLSMALSS